MKITKIYYRSFAFNFFTLQITETQARSIWEFQYAEHDPYGEGSPPSPEEDNENQAPEEELNDMDPSDNDNYVSDESVTSIELGIDQPSNDSNQSVTSIELGLDHSSNWDPFEDGHREYQLMGQKNSVIACFKSNFLETKCNNRQCWTFQVLW